VEHAQVVQVEVGRVGGLEHDLDKRLLAVLVDGALDFGAVVLAGVTGRVVDLQVDQLGVGKLLADLRRGLVRDQVEKEGTVDGLVVLDEHVALLMILGSHRRHMQPADEAELQVTVKVVRDADDAPDHDVVLVLARAARSVQLDVGGSTLARHALGSEALLVTVEENDARPVKLQHLPAELVASPTVLCT